MPNLHFSKARSCAHFDSTQFLQYRPTVAIMGPMAAKSHKDKDKRGPVAANKKAYRNFELVEKFEAGLALLGTEVK